MDPSHQHVAQSLGPSSSSRQTAAVEWEALLGFRVVGWCVSCMARCFSSGLQHDLWGSPWVLQLSFQTQLKVHRSPRLFCLCCYSARASSPQELGGASPSSAVFLSAGFNIRLLPFWFHLREISASLIFPLLCRSPLCNCQLRLHPDEPFSESQRNPRELHNQETSKKCSLILCFCRDPELSAACVCIVEPQDAS